jgi:alpha-glucan,water dikinase
MLRGSLYWEVIHAGGIDRARLESFARPVTLEPEDFPHCREHLIRDFEEYLGVLKSVHAGTDLGVAANAARGALPGGAAGALDVVLTQRNNPLAVLPAAVEVCVTPLLRPVALLPPP